MEEEEVNLVDEEENQDELRLPLIQPQPEDSERHRADTQMKCRCLVCREEEAEFRGNMRLYFLLILTWGIISLFTFAFLTDDITSNSFVRFPRFDESLLFGSARTGIALLTVLAAVLLVFMNLMIKTSARPKKVQTLSAPVQQV